MTKELKAKLEKALLDAGLNKAELSFITVEKEDDIQGVVDNLKKLIPTPEEPKLEDLIQRKDVRSHFDKKITEALNKKKDPIKSDDPPKTPTEITPETIADIVAKAQEPLLAKLGDFERNKARDVKLSQARTLLRSSKIPEKLREFHLKNLNTDSEEPLEDWVRQQEEEHQTYHQSMVDAGVVSSAPDKGYKPNTEMSAEEAQAIVDRIKV